MSLDPKSPEYQKKIKELFNWKAFEEWANETGINLDHEDDYGPWWECWKVAYFQALNDKDLM